jgi:DNA-binding transcriptional ArsR family regulator
MTALKWDLGTAYDMFVSLSVLSNPSDFGVRPAWAAGMRSRLPSEERETIETFAANGMPLHWVHRLPEPKDGQTALSVLEDLRPEGRMPALHFHPGFPEAVREYLEGIAARGAWEEAALEELSALFKEHFEDKRVKRDHLEALLEAWADLEATGERLLRALRAYHEVFFAEEERRIEPALRAALERAQGLAEEMPVGDLLEELSQGVRLDQDLDMDTLVLAPSFWGTPLLIFGELGERGEIILFGARPADASLVPGEAVPENLLRALKALSDPTRMRILRYLSEEELTSTQLARRLRLRPSTVVHHLHTLRLATLVHLKLTEGKERYYATREDTLKETTQALQTFLGVEGES